VTAIATDNGLAERRERLAQMMVLILPAFGRWASTIRDFETPYGKAGIRQLEVLYMLRHNMLNTATPTATALADYFQIQRSVLTRILAKLEAAGYISREANPRDGRAWHITITENGKNLSDYVEQKYFEEMATALGPINESTTACLEHSLELLINVAANLGVGHSNQRLDKIRQPSS
jgi:DNA-binding MarR family transcriptional regulator